MHRGLKYDAFLMLYKALVRSHLEYANSVWKPHHMQEIKALEQVQMRAALNLKQNASISVLTLIQYRSL